MKQTLSPVRFTHSERRVVDGLRKKFFLINGVFYLCWLPNIINGIVLWTSWNNLPKTFIITVWYLMVSCSHFSFHPSSFSPCKYSYKSYFDILYVHVIVHISVWQYLFSLTVYSVYFLLISKNVSVSAEINRFIMEWVAKHA